jgi:hypothetical protein
MKKYIKYFAGGLVALGLVFSMFGQAEVSAQPQVPEYDMATIQPNLTLFAAGADQCKSGAGIMGWILCPILNGFSDFIDLLMGWIGDSLKWTMSDELINLWTNILPIANVFFAIVFIIVVYSTATGAGLTNYSIKKVLPRLVVCAVAINVSYYICAALADLSNIVGANIETLFISTNTLTSYTVGNAINDGLSSLTSTIGIIILLVCCSGAAALAILTILLALTGRLVVLYLLVVISPLGIVCALLPQTEKWFQKWLKTFVQLLAAYPIFMLAWHGIRWIQANEILYKNNDIEANIVGWVISLLLPIAPLFVIIPAMKFGGGLMGKMTGAIQKGVQSSPLGKAAKRWDDSNQKALKKGMSNLGNREDLARPTNNEDMNEEAREEEILNAARSKGYVGNDSLAARNHLAVSDPDELQKIDGAFDASSETARDVDAANAVWNALPENAERIARRRRWNNNRGIRALGASGRFLAGETGKRRNDRITSALEEDVKRRTAESNQALFDHNTDHPSHSIGRSFQNAFLGAGGEQAKMRAEDAEKRYQNAVDTEKLSGTERGDGQHGRLYNTQSQLNASMRRSETLQEALKSDVEGQKMLDNQNIERMRRTKARIEQAQNVQTIKTELANEDDLDTVRLMTTGGGARLTGELRERAEAMQSQNVTKQFTEAAKKEVEKATNRVNLVAGSASHNATRVLNSANRGAESSGKLVKAQAGEQARADGTYIEESRQGETRLDTALKDIETVKENANAHDVEVGGGVGHENARAITQNETAKERRKTAIDKAVVGPNMGGTGTLLAEGQAYRKQADIATQAADRKQQAVFRERVTRGINLVTGRQDPTIEGSVGAMRRAARGKDTAESRAKGVGSGILSQDAAGLHGAAQKAEADEAAAMETYAKRAEMGLENAYDKLRLQKGTQAFAEQAKLDDTTSIKTMRDNDLDTQATERRNAPRTGKGGKPLPSRTEMIAATERKKEAAHGEEGKIKSEAKAKDTEHNKRMAEIKAKTKTADSRSESQGKARVEEAARAGENWAIEAAAAEEEAKNADKSLNLANDKLYTTEGNAAYDARAAGDELDFRRGEMDDTIKGQKEDRRNAPGADGTTDTSWNERLRRSAEAAGVKEDTGRMLTENNKTRALNGEMGSTPAERAVNQANAERAAKQNTLADDAKTRADGRAKQIISVKKTKKQIAPKRTKKDVRKGGTGDDADQIDESKVTDADRKEAADLGLSLERYYDYNDAQNRQIEQEATDRGLSPAELYAANVAENAENVDLIQSQEGLEEQNATAKAAEDILARQTLERESTVDAIIEAKRTSQDEQDRQATIKRKSNVREAKIATSDTPEAKLRMQVAGMGDGEVPTGSYSKRVEADNAEEIAAIVQHAKDDAEYADTLKKRALTEAQKGDLNPLKAHIKHRYATGDLEDAFKGITDAMKEIDPTKNYGDMSGKAILRQIKNTGFAEVKEKPWKQFLIQSMTPGGIQDWEQYVLEGHAMDNMSVSDTEAADKDVWASIAAVLGRKYVDSAGKKWVEGVSEGEKSMVFDPPLTGMDDPRVAGAKKMKEGAKPDKVAGQLAKAKDKERSGLLTLLAAELEVATTGMSTKEAEEYKTAFWQSVVNNFSAENFGTIGGSIYEGIMGGHIRTAHVGGDKNSDFDIFNNESHLVRPVKDTLIDIVRGKRAGTLKDFDSKRAAEAEAYLNKHYTGWDDEKTVSDPAGGGRLNRWRWSIGYFRTYYNTFFHRLIQAPNLFVDAKKFQYLAGGLVAIALSFSMFGPTEASVQAAVPDAEYSIASIKPNLSLFASECTDNAGLLGWFLCPGQDLITGLINGVMNLIAESMKWGFSDKIADLWTQFLPIANIAFAIVFMIVIYSTATGVGLTNYSVKKILPRLVVVAIAVNVSYYICSAMADLSNILGDSLEGFFDGITTASWDLETVIGGIFQNLASGFFSAMGIVILLICCSGMAALAVLTIFLALTARYVTLLLLVVISPLAIVLALLPQTEKWFRKWLTTFVQMLAVYPIFMFAWHGIRFIQDNQLLNDAGAVGGIISILLPIAPLFVILPAMKFGGGLMGKMTGAIQSGVKNSPLGKAAQRFDDSNRKAFTRPLNDLGNEDTGKKAIDNADKVKAARNNAVLNAAKEKGIDTDNIEQAESALGKEELDKIGKNYEPALEAAKKIDTENSEYNGEHSAEIAAREMRNKRLRAMGKASQLLTGEMGKRRNDRLTEALASDADRRDKAAREALLKKESNEDSHSDNPLAKATRGLSNAFMGAGTESAKMRAEAAGASYENAISQEKMSAVARRRAGIVDEDGNSTRKGSLYGLQSKSNALKQTSDVLNKELGADADQQASLRVDLLDRGRMADNRSTIAKGLQNKFIDEANKNDTEYMVKIRQPMLDKKAEAERVFREALDGAKGENEDYKNATIELEIAEANKATIEAEINEHESEAATHTAAIAEATKISKEEGLSEKDKQAALDLVTEEEAKLNEAKAAIVEKQAGLTTAEDVVATKTEAQKTVLENIKQSAPVAAAQAKVDVASRELAATEDTLRNNTAFQLIDTAKRAENAKASYEAAVSRASRGLTSEVDAQKINQIKDLSTAELETDKSQRLAENEEMQNVDRQIRATKERTVNINRAVNVDYATKIKDSKTLFKNGQTLATYAGGGGVADTRGELRQSDDLAMMQSMGAADKVADSDYAERTANIKSYLDNNPSKTHWYDLNAEGGLVKRAIAEKNTAVLNAINEYEKGKGQIGKMQEVIDQVSETTAFKADADLRQFVVSQNIKLGEESFVDQNYAKYVGALEDVGLGHMAMARNDWLKINSSGEVSKEVAIKYGIKGETLANGRVVYKPKAAFVPLTDITGPKVAKYDKDAMEQLAKASPENFRKMAEDYGVQNINGSGTKKQMAMFKEILVNQAEGRDIADTILTKIKAGADINSSSKKPIIELLTGKPTDAKGALIKDIGPAEEKARSHIRDVLVEKFKNPNLRGDMTEEDIIEMLRYAIYPGGGSEDVDTKNEAIKKILQKSVSINSSAGGRSPTGKRKGGTSRSPARRPKPRV